jgi:hypothetical protein
MKGCTPCQIDKFHCYGGDKIAPIAGYWRIKDSSDKFISCPNPDTCLYFHNLLCVNIYIYRDISENEYFATGKC